jgi:hypothetical protein
VRGVGREYAVEVLLSEDQHSVTELGADGQHEAFGQAVRPRTPRRHLDDLDAHVAITASNEGRGLSGAIADEGSTSGDVFAEFHDEVADLLGGPGAVRVRGRVQHVRGAVAKREHDGEPPQRDRAQST